MLRRSCWRLPLPILAFEIFALALLALQTNDPSGTIFYVLFFIGLAAFAPAISKAMGDWHRSKIMGRFIIAISMSLLPTLLLAVAVGSIAEYIMPGWEDGGSVGLPVFIVGFAVSTLWIASSIDERQAASRGCGLTALTAFALPVYAIGYAIVGPTVQEPIFPTELFAFLFGVPVGIISAIASLYFSKFP